MRVVGTAVSALLLFLALNLIIGPTISSGGFDMHPMLGVTITWWHDARGIELSEFRPVVFAAAYGVAFLAIHTLFAPTDSRKREISN